MAESFSTVSSVSPANVRSKTPESLCRCNSTSLSWQYHSCMDRSLGWEFNCIDGIYSSNSQPKSDQCINEAGDTFGHTEVYSSHKNGSYGDNSLKLDLDLRLGVNHVEINDIAPNPNSIVQSATGRKKKARILTARKFHVPQLKREDDNSNMYTDSRSLVNALEGSNRSYHEVILGQPRPVQGTASVKLKEIQGETPVIKWNEAKHLAFSSNNSRQSRSFAINHSGMASLDGFCNLSRKKEGELCSFNHNLIDNRFTIIRDYFITSGEAKGWHPIRAYHGNSLGSLPKPSREKQQGASVVQGHKNSFYIKVNMDGTRIGRKVNLNAYQSYESLARDLEKMFQPTIENLVLAFEDSEGDCVLVGDVPWEMFLHKAKRLRIIKSFSTHAFDSKCSGKRKAT